MTRTLPAEILDRLANTFEAARDPDRAVSAAAYMRDQFPFLGIPTPRRTALSRTVLAGLPKPTEPELRAVADACWAMPEREFQYFAVDWLRANVRVCGPDMLDSVRVLLTTKSWWDTVDLLATRFVGGLVTAHPRLVADLDDWSTDDNLWLVRTAILYQLHYGAATDTDRLFGYCTRQAGHPDFFVRKAIGWALRHYARTDPDAVRAYVAQHRDQLSPLSVREALKRI